MPSQTFAFDVYGTLIDTEGVLLVLEEIMGEKAQRFSSLWRTKQLEYSFRRGLMDAYVDFSICTKEAMEYSCQATGIVLGESQKNTLMEAYKTLPAFSDVKDCLTDLKKQGHEIYAFSNGSLKAIQGLLQHAHLTEVFDGAVSMEAVRTFKPNPKGYENFVQSTGAQKESSWLISGNPFDVIGASSYGLHTIWLQRSSTTVFDPMGYEPTLILKSLSEMPSQIEQFLLSSL